MFKRRSSLSIIGRNRYELYLSLGVVIFGFCYSAVRPQSFNHAIVWTGSTIFGLVCALNAVSDYKRMFAVERIFAFTWLVLLMYLTLLAVWDTVTIEAFSPR